MAEKALSPRLSVEELSKHVADIKVHAEVSSELDEHHSEAMKLPLGRVSDEQLLAEVARRGLDVHHTVTADMVKKVYKFVKLLGHGASGEVHLVEKLSNGERFACKIVARDGSMNDLASMSTEIEIMKRVRHRHVVSMYELFESPKCLWIILELVDGGDVRGLLAQLDHYSEALASKHMKQMFQGIHYLHSRGIVHRDLKMDNILIAGEATTGDIKLADFGLSALVEIGRNGYDANESSKRKHYNGLEEMWGTPTHYAPELIKGGYGPQADIWSLGCVLYEMLTGEPAFECYEDEDDNALYKRILHREINMDKLKGISAEGKDLLLGLLTVDPTKRLSATEALKHPWITGEAHTDDHHQHLHDTHTNMKKKVEVKVEKGNDGKTGLMDYFFKAKDPSAPTPKVSPRK